jgi:hypothetical protein
VTRRERLEKRLEKREAWADSASSKSATEFQKAHSALDGMTGEPIHLGHHSEKRHRAALEKSDSAMRRGVDASHHASEHADKAANLARQLDRTVFSDDEDAIEKIEARIATHERLAAAMTSVNKAWKKAKGNPDERAAQLVADGVCSEKTATTAAQTMRQFAYLKAPLDMTNIRARIRTDKKRLEEIRAQQARAERAKLAGGVSIEGQGNVIDNELFVRVTFAEKPENEVLDALREAGFRWSGGGWIGKRDSIPTVVREMATKQEC